MTKNIKLTGIKNVCSDSKYLSKNPYSGEYLQVNVNMTTGRVWDNWHCDFGHGTTTIYNDNDIINCGIVSHPMTMAEIRKMVQDSITMAAAFSM